MKGIIGEYIRQLHIERSRHRRTLAWTSVLALLVVSSIVWGLRVKGISMVNELDCGIDEHVHNDRCYELYQICGMNEGDIDDFDNIHVHEEACFEKTLVCEQLEHVHTVDCVDIEEQYDDKNVEEETDEKTDLQCINQNDVENLDGDVFIEEYEEENELYGIANPSIDLELTDARIEQFIREYPKTHTVIPGRIYVVTATGVRDKDEMHEYLEAANGALNNIHVPAGKTREEICNGDFFVNYGDNSANDPYRYVTYNGLPLVLCVYRNSVTGDGYLWSSPSDGDIPSGVIPLDAGMSATYRKCNPAYTNEKRDYIFTPTTGDSEHFYTEVLSTTKTYDHADIEITDGGFFEITTKREFANGTYQEIVTKYDSYVSQVESCRIYGDSNETNVLEYFVTGDYEPKNEKGQTQFELTSKYRCMGRKSFHVNEIDHAVFELKLKLAPTESKITLYEDSSKSRILSTDNKNFANADGSFNYQVTPITVNLGKQSVVDALNKCPDHSGLDFNLLYREINMEALQPTNSEIKIHKTVAGGLEYNQFDFELLDDEGNVIDTKKPDDVTGIVTFDMQDYPIPGTYRYKIREVIPNKDNQIEPDVYYYNGVRYDGRVIDVIVTVVTDPSVEDTIMHPPATSEPLHTNLIARVRYEYKGQLLVENPNDNELVDYKNSRTDFETTNITVKKVWDGAAKSSVTFRIIQTKNGTEKRYYEVDGASVFELNAGMGWSRTFSNIPTKVGDDIYTYDVQETKISGYSATYTKSTNISGVTYTITNVANDNKNLYIKKVWLNENGVETESPAGVDKVSVKLKRRYRETEIPVKVELQSDNAGPGEFTSEFTLNGYSGSTVSFQIEQQAGVSERLQIYSTSECTCQISADNVYTISNIADGASVVLRYPHYSLSDVKLHHTDSSGFSRGDGNEKWSALGGELFDCYSTYNSGGTGPVGFLLGLRTHDWAQARLKLSTENYVPGERYSFSAYMLFRNQHTLTASDKTSTTKSTVGNVKMQLLYKDSANNVQYRDIASMSPAENTWCHVVNTDFEIPIGASDVYLVIGTLNETSAEGRYPDIYFDDVIIAKRGARPSVDSTEHLSLAGEYNLANENIQIPLAATQWTEDLDIYYKDDANSERGTGQHAFSIEKTKLWLKDYENIYTNYHELPNREYQYYVVEQPIPGGYKVSYENNDGIAYNTPDNPIIVKNQYCTYVLPSTGGYGTNRIRWLGLLLVIIGIIPVFWNLVRKRGKPTG